MLFEDILIILAGGISVFFIGVPLWRLAQLFHSKKRDAVAEAKIRLEVAKKDLEAARLNKETEKLYEEMYRQALEDETDHNEKDEKKL